MAAGSITRPTVGPYAFQKNWSGTDGRVETINGVVQAKYNTYTMNSTNTVGSKQNVYGREYIPNSFPKVYDLTAGDILKLQSRLTSAIRSHEFNLGVALAEGRKTVDMIQNNVARIANSFVQAKHGNIRAALRELGIADAQSHKKFKSKDVSARILEIQYGWKPLLSDVYNAAKAYEVLTQKPRRSSVKVTVTAPVYRDSFTVAVRFADDKIRVRQVSTASRSLRVVLLEQLTGTRSLGLQDPLSVAWELTPWSFVFDWFLPVGSYLENLATIPFIRGYFNQTVYLNHLYTGLGVGPTSSYYGSRISGDWRKFYRYARTDSIPVEMPSFKPLDKALSPVHVFNAIALAHQVTAR